MWRRSAWLLALVMASGVGCSSSSPSFRDLNDPTPVVRARAAGLDDQVADAVAIPALIARLNDPDAVVRLSAHEALRTRTGRDFGFEAWGTPEQRSRAVRRWRSWWAASQQAARPRFPSRQDR